ncbi:RNA-directed DNA polymerase [Lentilactobacillus hilgardii]|uniref:Reverse transcriptase domain-containing protein n=2 Tax=Lentilactobacillus hilgardii TaxID=1588 RepID=C0XH01_LENH9|nr:RNA-directed DNA polymerase [Lentilactobacillus hilgardii]EEI25379.1 hypothetical protein HMPREF0519_0512 [Lentilactobacillus hilgardii DSM 20176 = ATCC 8290]KRK55521.1 hypothetical protein FD42_GL000941 [Lentilactobacillus hilgardii DSM 20176 = ATCC 8290]TDG79396.1 hypothetical protein C5L34_002366 [Lentilactobacillus hilgardii]
MSNDYFLRTEVLPYELPALFSNNFLCKLHELSESKIKSDFHVTQGRKKLKNKAFFGASILRGVNYTKPLDFIGTNANKKRRTLSLLHPYGQILTMLYTLRFQDYIVDTAKRSSFSIRSPRKRNSNEINSNDTKIKNWQRIYESINLSSTNQVTSEEDKVLFNHFFSYFRTDNYSSMASSTFVKQIQNQFQYVLKTDVQNFFPSIYTHSLAWALYGSKSVGKEQKGDKNSFPNLTDYVLHNINFDETNGIIVGLEFSRIIAELLMSVVDNKVEVKIYKKYRYRFRVNYFIIRFVDDIFIFSNSLEANRNIFLIMKDVLDEFNLKVNDKKLSIFEDSATVFTSCIDEIKQLFELFKVQKRELTLFSVLKGKDALDSDPNTGKRGRLIDWKNLFNGIHQIASKNSQDLGKITHYSLSSINSILNFVPDLSIKERKVYVVIIEGLSGLLKNSCTYTAIQHYILNISKLIHNLESSKNSLEMQSELMKSQQISYDLDMELIFKSQCRILDNNWFSVDEGYELINFMKYYQKLSWMIPSRILINLLHLDDSHNFYFINASIAYYILDNKTNEVQRAYRTVYKVLFRRIRLYIQKNIDNGIDPLLDGNFFYVLNDFLKYPGILKTDKEWLSKVYNNLKGKSKSSDLDKITSDSYFQWNGSFDTFLKNVIKKKVVHQLNITDLNVSF